MKKAFSFILAVVMLLSITSGLDFSVFADEHTHDYDITTTHATCVAQGSAVYKCKLCDYSYSEALPIDENAHKLVNGKCLYCGFVDESYTVSYTELSLGTSTGKPIPPRKTFSTPSPACITWSDATRRCFCP